MTLEHPPRTLLDLFAVDGFLPTDGHVEALRRSGWITTARGYDVEWLRACARMDAMLHEVEDVRIVLDADRFTPGTIFRWDPREGISRFQDSVPFRYIDPDAAPGYRPVLADEHRHIEKLHL